MTKSKNNLKKTTLRVLLALAFCAIVCLMLPLSVSASEGDGSVAVNETNFPDETFRNIILSAEFDIDQDGFLSPEEIASVTILWLEGRGFTDITGVNYFTELTQLEAQDNNFTSLDLSGLSKLEILYLGGNPNLASLNLDGCTALKKLNLVECKVAASLDFSAFTELTYLSVGSVRDLYSLDISANTKLEWLYVSSSSLTSLDLSNNPLITKLNDSTYRIINHCGVGYVDMNLYGDINKMINITGGTMDADGWLKLEVGAFEILYEYITGDSTPNLSVCIVFNDDYANQHTYINQPVSKDATQHYTQMCETCRTFDETTVEAHTLDKNGVCTANCGYACPHTNKANGICPDCDAYDEPAQADGVYQIGNAGNLLWFAELVNGGDKNANAALIADIDMSDIQNWIPIGNITNFDHSTADLPETGYHGTFDGKGFVIKNLTLNGDVSYVTSGIFGTVSGTVKNLGVDNYHYVKTNTSLDGRFGAIAGLVAPGGVIEDCYVINSTVNSDAKVAGVIAGANYAGTIQNCFTYNCVVKGYEDALQDQYRYGWIVGDNCNDGTGTDTLIGTVTNCYTDGIRVSSTQGGTENACRALVNANKFASGEIAYLLSAGRTDSIWSQTIETDTLPTFGSEKVIRVTVNNCNEALVRYEYENGTADYTKVLDHIFSADDGKCTVCHLQKAISVTIGDIPYFFDSFSNAIAKAEEGTSSEPATIKLYTDITVAEAVTMTGGVATLDLNGKTVSFTTQGGACLTLDGVNLTICDTSAANTGTLVFDMTGYFDSYGGITLDNASTLTIEGGTLKGEPGSPLMLLGGSTVIQNGGTVNNGVWIDNGKYTLNDGILQLPFHSNSDGSNRYTAEITINSGDILLDVMFMDNRALHDPYIITITGGNFTQNMLRFANWLDSNNVNISGGSFDNGIQSEITPLVELLAAGYAFYDAEGNIIILTEDQTEITGKVTVGVCKHSFVYTASDNVITETCANLACSHSATATVSTDSTHYDYNGKAHTATVTYSDGWAGGELTVSYSGTAEDNSDYAVTGPISVGNITASISIGGVTAESYFGIGQAKPDLGDISVESPATVYTSTAIADVVLGRTNTTVPGTLTLDSRQYLMPNQTEYNWTFTPDDTVNYDVTTGTVSITVIQDVWVKLEIVTPPTKTTYTYGERFDITGIKVVATYLSGLTEEIPYNKMDDKFTPDELTVATTEVSCTLTYDYVNEFTITQKITVNPKVVDNAFIELVHSNYFYTGQPIEGVVYTVYDGDYWIAASEYTVVITNNTDVGTATVTIVDVAGGNYVVSGSTTFEIVPAKITNASVSQTDTLTYTGSAQTPTVNASATTVDGAAVTFTYSLEQNGTYTAEVPTVVGGGTHIIYFKVNAERHEEYSGTFEVVVGKATNGWAINPGIADWTYGETPPTPVGQAMFGTVKYYHKPMGTDIVLEGLPTEPGRYYLVAKIDTTDDYYGGRDEGCIFDIYKAETTADIFDFTLPANLNVCDGSAKEATVTVKEGIEGVGSVTIKYFKNGEPIDGAPTTVGTYTVKIGVAEGANYKPATLTAEAWTFTFDITDEAAHTGVTLVSNGDGTHNKVCSVCEKVFENRVTCTDSDTDAICDICGAFTFPGTGTEADPYQVDTFDELVAACIDDAFVKLVGYIEFSGGGNVHISGTTHLCLNGYTLNLANSNIKVNAGGVLTVCNCAANAGSITAYVIPIFNYGTLILSGDPIITNDPDRSGGNGAVAMYSGAKIDAAAYTGGDVTVELVRMALGDVIVENVTEANQDKFKVATRGYTLEQTDKGTLVMAKATPTADIFDFTPPTNLNACDGLAKEATVTVKEGIEGVGSITIKYFKNGEPIDGAPTTVGTYTVKIEVAEGANYKSATLTDEAWTFTFDVADEAEHTDTDFDSVCDDCGADVTHIEFSKVSLTLGGDIGINYFFTLGDTVLANEAYFLITYPDGSTERIAVSRDLLGTPKGDTSGNIYYKVTARVAAKEMADNVKVELFVNEIPVKAFNYSIQQYANVIFADASSEVSLVELVKKMLNYGAASQVALGYNTDKLANSILDESDKTVNAVDASALTGATTEGTVSGFEYQMFSCILETKTTLRQYFTLPEGSVSEYTFTIDGESVTPIKTTVEGKTMYYIDVANIAARDMDVVHTLVITKGDETRTITCSVHSYMKAVLTKNSEDTELVNTVNAMYEYNQAAKQYLDQTFN